MSQGIPVITIDGPSGSGKGTVGKRLAAKLGWHYLDSGALYRILAFAAIQKNIPLDNISEICDLAKAMMIRFFTDGDSYQVLLDGKDVTDDLAGEDVGEAASTIAAEPAIRDALLSRQRAFRQLPGLITDGRDMGTVVFPDAKPKFYLDAALEKRAQRRYRQLQERGKNVKLDKIYQDLEQRDKRDRARTVAPLKPADDAIVIDSSELTIKEAYDRVLLTIQTTLDLGNE